MSRILNERISTVLRRIVLTILLFLSCLQIDKSQEETLEVPIEIHFYLGAIIFLVALLVIRRVPIKRFETWIVLIAGYVIKLIYFRQKNISPLTYGPDYSRLVSYKWIIVIVFAALMVDLIRCGTLGRLLKRANALFYIALVALILAVVNCHDDWFPLICPMVALLLTYLEDRDWTEFTDSLAIGYFVAFTCAMVRSLIVAPDAYQSGRYYGTFSNMYCAGIVAGGALLCVLYAYTRLADLGMKTAVRICIALLLAIFPLYSVIKIESRTVEFSLLVVCVALFLFYPGSSKKKIAIKFIIVLATAAVGIVTVLVLARHFYNQMQGPGYDYSSYFKNALTFLADPERRKGYFGEDSFLNSIDYFTSGRLGIYAESLKQVRIWGHPFEMVSIGGAVTPHNFFIQWLVEYGVIGGIVLISWYIIGFVKAASLCVRKKGVFPLLWISYTFVIFMALTGTWLSVEAFFLLVLQYPLLMKHMNDSDSHATE